MTGTLGSRLFADDPPASVLRVHGPAGIGRARCCARSPAAARDFGWSPRFIEGCDQPPVPAAAERLADHIAASPR